MKTVKENPCMFEPLEGRQMFNGGTLDASFGTNGRVDPQLGFAVHDIAMQPDGKTVVVGSTLSLKNILVARLNSNGSLDRSFSGNGIAQVRLQLVSAEDRVAIQPDGKIIVAGIEDTGGFFTNGNFGLARFNADGSLDSTFGTAGKSSPFASQFFTRGLSALAVGSNGKIVVTAAVDDVDFGEQSDLMVGRLNSNGTIDTTFGNPDPRHPGQRRGFTQTDFDGSEDASCIAIQPNGKIVVGGTQTGEKLLDDTSPHSFLLARYTSNGALDGTFDGDGRVSVRMSPRVSDELNSIVVQPDGKIVAGGLARDQFGLVRINLDGTIDQTFGSGGKVFKHVSQRRDILNSLILDIHGNITAVGTADKNFDEGDVGKKLAAVQFLPNGQIDGSFGVNGVASLDNSLVLGIKAVRAPEGKIVIAGDPNPDKSNAASIFRVSQATPVVEVLSQKTDSSKEGTDAGSIMIKRDDAYNFPTRVFLDISGTATEGADYTSSQLHQLSLRERLGGIGKSLLPKYYVNIPAGRSSVIARINGTADTQLEPSESVTWSPIANAAYDLGAGNAGHVTILDSNPIHVNFGYLETAPTGYAQDEGKEYNERGNELRFGWETDITRNADVGENAQSPDLRFDTFVKMQRGGKHRWEIAVPNGMYTVHLVAGDPGSTDSVYKLNLEKRFALSGIPHDDVRWFERTFNIEVNDGNLTLSNHKGSRNNKIAFIDIQSAAPGAVEGPVTGNQAVSLVTPQPKRALRNAANGRLFSQVTI
jgi:uncharacterized delta-60 repeat protein